MGRKGKGDKEPELLDRTRSYYFNPQAARDSLELLDMCVNALHDRSAATREAAMTALAGALEALPRLDEIDSRCFTIFAFCGISIKQGSPKEARLAYRVVGLLALTLRYDSPCLLDESFPLLSRTIQARGVAHDDAPTVLAALDCLAAVTFAGARGAEDVERSMKAVWNVIISPPVSRSSKLPAKTSPKVLAAAVSTWTFLVTTVTPAAGAARKSDRAAWNATVSSLAGLLENDDRAVRMAAGEALAVCVELNLAQHVPRKDMDALAAKASELAGEAAGRGSNNTLLPEQKYVFRQVAAFLDRDEKPRESVTVRRAAAPEQRRAALKVSTWVKLVQLNFLRRFLGGGFLKHAHGNELFKEAFCLGADEGKVPSIANTQHFGEMKEEILDVVNDDWFWQRTNIHSSDRYRSAVHPEKLLQAGWH